MIWLHDRRELRGQSCHRTRRKRISLNRSFRSVEFVPVGQAQATVVAFAAAAARADMRKPASVEFFAGVLLEIPTYLFGMKSRLEMNTILNWTCQDVRELLWSAAASGCAFASRSFAFAFAFATFVSSLAAPFRRSWWRLRRRREKMVRQSPADFAADAWVSETLSDDSQVPPAFS